MRKIFNKFWPLLVIIFTVAIFFYPVWLQNKVPLPADLLVGAYYPWLDYKWGYPTGVPVKNPITADAVSFIYPMRTYAVDLLKQGLVPLWNPLILSGTPLLANFQSAPFSPTNIFYFIFPKLDAWSLQIIFQPLLASLFLYFLLREFGLSKLSSLSGGIFFAFAGFMTIWMEWNAHSLVAAFFPLIILLTLKWLKTNKLLYGAFLSLSFALQIFSGYPQIILYEFLILGVLIFIFDQGFFRQPKRVLTLGLYIALGFGAASIQILPGFELIRESQRNLETLTSEFSFIPWQSLIMLFAPDYFGNHTTYNYWGPAHYTIASGYTGIITLILAILGFLTSHKLKGVNLAICIIAVAVLLGFENPISVSIQKSNFLGLQAASSQRILLFFNLGISILAAFGLDYLLTKNTSLKNVAKSLILPTLALSALTLYTILSLYFDPKTNLEVGLRNLVFPNLFLFSSMVALFLIVKVKRLTRYFTFVLILLSVAELFRFGWKFEPFTSKNLVFPETPVINYLQDQPKPFRAVASSVIPTNLLMPYGIETVEGYDATYPLQIAKFLSAINTNSPNNNLGRYGTINNLNSNLISLADAKFLIVSKEYLGIDDSRLQKVFEDRSVVVLNNRESLPRALMFYDWEVEAKDVTLGKLLDKAFLLADKIILDISPELKKNESPPTSRSGSVDLADYEDKLVVKVKTDSPGLLYIANSWYPGWKAYVNDREVNILKANFNFMAVPIDRTGEFIVRLDYQPDSFKIGAIISAASFLIVAFLILSEYFRKVKI